MKHFRLAIDESWQERAACAGMNESIFFGRPDSSSEGSVIDKHTERARAICNRCPVFNECLKYSLNNRELYGIWAGTSRRTREKLLNIIDAEILTLEAIVENYKVGKTHLAVNHEK